MPVQHGGLLVAAELSCQNLSVFIGVVAQEPHFSVPGSSFLCCPWRLQTAKGVKLGLEQAYINQVVIEPQIIIVGHAPLVSGRSPKFVAQVALALTRLCADAK